MNSKRQRLNSDDAETSTTTTETIASETRDVSPSPEPRHPAFGDDADTSLPFRTHGPGLGDATTCPTCCGTEPNLHTSKFCFQHSNCSWCGSRAAEISPNGCEDHGGPHMSEPPGNRWLYHEDTEYTRGATPYGKPLTAEEEADMELVHKTLSEIAVASPRIKAALAAMLEHLHTM